MEDMPPGFRFFPTEDELVSFYLQHKLNGTRDDLDRLMDRVIPVVDIYAYNPWDLPQFSVYLCHKDKEQWFFFIPRRESEARGGRPRRLTTTGYWKATGSPGCVYSNNRAIGVKRTMVFYKGRAPSGQKTEWKMNEYKAIDGEASSSTAGASPTLRHEFSLCRIYKKSKNLRSFDRRPPPALMPGQPGAAQLQLGLPAVAGSSLQNPLKEDQKMTCSPESSSSGEHGNIPSQSAGKTGGSRMIGDDEYFLDIDEFWDAVK
ncbi:hypothetical protein SLEP1_g46751 [Rubroshorea leprosula]|uniref:NAC domain-containing protein n=1 Tax=Rubroshorea leprosula TaxID=152421 RepID=A0AAV5LNZ4_9ROSI|nr:hypothetical protein SLEP1_g46751 [Rubroshorea leprosula]